MIMGTASGGVEIALACDLRYCAASAEFGIPAAKLGLGYNIEGHKRLLETVGHAWRARSCSSARYQPRRRSPWAWCTRAARCGARALCRWRARDAVPERTACHRQHQDDLEQYVKSEGMPDTARMRAAIERCAKSADYIEGRRAFMEKRKPRFTGK